MEKAIADYGESIRLNPDYAEAYKNRGEARFSLKDPKGAIEDYSRVIKLKFEEAETYNRIGIIQASLDNHPEAIVSFTQAIKYSSNDSPERAKSYNYRGKSKAASRNFKGAIEDYTEAIELSSVNSYIESSSIQANALINRAIIYEDQSYDHKSAIKDLNNSISLKQSPEAYRQLGRVYQRAGNKQDSLKNYQRAANLFQEIGNTKDSEMVMDEIKKSEFPVNYCHLR